MNDPGKITCSICGNSKFGERVLHYDRRKALTGSWSLYKCKQCGVIAIYPSPTEDELIKYYSVYSHNKSVTFTPRVGSRYPMLRKMYHWISGDIDPRDFIKPGGDSIILDYGCGEAGCLFDFHLRGVKISGAEISAEMVNACQKFGLDVHQVTSPDNIPFGKDTFDIVYLMQVFEHIRNPHVFLDELFRVLKPGGVLFMAMPNSKSKWKSLFGKNWVSGWFAPFHLFHYDKKNLIYLSQQHGFEVIKTWSRTPASWFRLNIKAYLNPYETRLEEHPSIVDSIFVYIPLMIILRIFELFILQSDCLVIKMAKEKGKCK